MPRIEVEIYGQTYTGSYEIRGEMIEVSHGGRTKKTQLGDYISHPELLARSLIRELALKEKLRSTGGLAGGNGSRLRLRCELTAMTSDLDVYRSAKLFIEQHGDEAAIQAAYRADAMLKEATWMALLCGGASSRSSTSYSARNRGRRSGGTRQNKGQPKLAPSWVMQEGHLLTGVPFS